MEFEDFRRDWLTKHQHYIPKKPELRKNIGGLILWVIIFISASVVSVAHTSPTIFDTLPKILTSEALRWVIAVFGFGAVELTIFASALHEARSRLARITLVLSTVVAGAANIWSGLGALQGNDTLTNPIIVVVVAVILGAGLPLIALLSGEMYAKLLHNDSAGNAVLISQYNEAMRTLDTTILSAYNKKTKNEISGNFNEISMKQNDENEISNGSEKAWKYFNENQSEAMKFLRGEMKGTEVARDFNMTPVQVTRLKKKLQDVYQ